MSWRERCLHIFPIVEFTAAYERVVCGQCKRLVPYGPKQLNPQVCRWFSGVGENKAGRAVDVSGMAHAGREERRGIGKSALSPAQINRSARTLLGSQRVGDRQSREPSGFRLLGEGRRTEETRSCRNPACPRSRPKERRKPRTQECSVFTMAVQPGTRAKGQPISKRHIVLYEDAWNREGVIEL